MARMYSRKKGKSGSKKPIEKKANWVTYKDKEIEDIVVKLSKKGMQTAEIGTVLRDQYGIPSVKVTNKAGITEILKANKISQDIPEDLFNLLKKAVNLRMHLDANKTDYTSYRGLELTESKIRKLAKYYIKEKSLPSDWKYDLEKAKLLVK